MIDRPHFAFPFVLGANGHVNVIEQDTEEHISSCENVIVRCPQGFRAERPEFGWPWPEFANVPIDVTSLEQALRRFEPRGRARAIEYADAASAAIRHISVSIEV